MPWFEIYVEDMKRACKFYEWLLVVELNLEDMPGGEMEMYLFRGEMSLPGGRYLDKAPYAQAE